jgi:hypothetical protein
VVFVNDARRGKSILRSNGLVWKTDANTLSPAGLRSPVKRVEIGSLNGEYPFHGCVDEVRLYDSALPLSEQLALYEAIKGTTADPRWDAAKTALLAKEAARQNHELFSKMVEEDARLSQNGRRRMADWLFQAEEEGLVARTDKELLWTREMIQRLQARADAPDLSGELAALHELEQRAGGGDAARDAPAILTRYFDVRALKRRVMFKSPEIDFSEIICVDAPYTRRSPDTHGTSHQNEWVHESRFRSVMCASHGAKLLVLRTERLIRTNGFTRAGFAARCAPRTARRCSSWKALRSHRLPVDWPRPTVLGGRSPCSVSTSPSTPAGPCSA